MTRLQASFAASACLIAASSATRATSRACSKDSFSNSSSGTWPSCISTSSTSSALRASASASRVAAYSASLLASSALDNACFLACTSSATAASFSAPSTIPSTFFLSSPTADTCPLASDCITYRISLTSTHISSSSSSTGTLLPFATISFWISAAFASAFALRSASYSRNFVAASALSIACLSPSMPLSSTPSSVTPTMCRCSTAAFAPFWASPASSCITTETAFTTSYGKFSSRLTSSMGKPSPFTSSSACIRRATSWACCFNALYFASFSSAAFVFSILRQH